MSVSATIKPLFAASKNGYRKSLTFFRSRRIQACFGWAKNESSLGYGAFFRYSKPGQKTITISMLLGILPVSAASLLEQRPVTRDSLGDFMNKIPPNVTSKKPSNLGILFKQPWILLFLIFRFIRLGLMFLPLMILYPLMRSNTGWKLVWLKMLLKAFEFSGPTFMKFGQWMSTRHDIFSPELCTVFSSLHRNVPPHAFDHTIKELDSAFGKNWRKKILFPSRVPVGSGCVGQVYRVKVLSDAINHQEPDQDIDSLGPFDITPIGSPTSGVSSKPREEYIDAALKVLHPRIHDQVNRDLIIFELGAIIFEILFRDLRWLRVKDSILEFSSLMNKQLDLRMEATNLDLFRQNFLNYQSVKFPVPYRPFVAKHVLMESWEEGVPIGSFINNLAPTELQKKLASIGVDALLKMAFIDNFVHADMHPGNLFVKNSEKFSTDTSKLVYEDIGDVVIVGVKKRPSPLNLVIIDAGLTASLSQYDFDSFKGVFAAVVLGDGNQVAEQFLQHTAADTCSDRKAFQKDMAKLVQEARSSLSLHQIDAGKLLTDLFSVLVKHQVKLESNFVSIMLSIMVLEGLGRSLDPNLDLLEKAKPVLLRRFFR